MNEVKQNLSLILQGVQEWVGAWKDKLASCSDPSGDRYAVQNKLDRLSDLQNQQKDGDSRIEQASELNAKTQLNTSSAGKKYSELFLFSQGIALCLVLAKHFVYIVH